MPTVTVMLDHPSWLRSDDGRVRRVVRSTDAVWSIVCTPQARGAGHAVEVSCVAGDGVEPPQIDIVDPSVLVGDPSVCGPLWADGQTGRVRNPDLWGALGASIIRQVIRAAQARKLYRAFCVAYGQQIETAAGPAWLFPTSERVLGLSDDEFAALGLKFHRRALRAAAEAFLKFGADWTRLPSTRLMSAVQSVPRIGPWTAGATVADVTNDYSLYPFADLAVRTWARHLAPSITWPETEREFARAWQAMAGAQLSEWTLLTLAWGVRHATGVAI